MAEGEAVKVAVRVRPFNGREINMNAKVCMRMEGATTYISDLDGGDEEKFFTFDYSYWSYDGFEDIDGYLTPSNDQYADQKKVFDDVGVGIRDNSWNGFNCSLFAYGQTGSGKSYSIIGYGPNKGVVPLYCEDLFIKMAELQKVNPDNEYQVAFSMLEIYNESVFDLLAGKQRKALKIRQSKQRGFFVQGLKKTPVGSYIEIEERMAEGTANRTVASTKMNATSSRAHTVVELTLIQKIKQDGANMTKTSVVNLVDLAGSERAGSTGATGATLKQGAAINKSLSALGNVIAALAKESEGGRTKVVIPFRDSSLTMILKNALGGNSKTVMIAALSPASVNYEETLSTLRFADRAKQIKTKATVNESPTDKLIRELKEENDKLKQMLEGGVIDKSMVKDDDEEDISDEEVQARLQALMDESNAEKASMEQEWKDKLEEAQKAIEALKEEQSRKQEMMKTIPHITNLNGDEQLCGMIVYFFEDGKENKVGTKDSDPPNDIVLSGLEIESSHCLITHSAAKLLMVVADEARVYVNGEYVSGKLELMHGDRLLLGANNLFTVVNPAEREAAEKAGIEYFKFTYHDAMSEIQNLGSGDDAQKGEELLQEDIAVLGPMIGEVNAMSCAMNKKVKFDIVIMPEEGKRRKKAMVSMFSYLTSCSYLLSREDFISRKYKMEEMYQQFVEGDESWESVPASEDPFVEDENKETTIGTVSISLKSLGYLFEQEQMLTITNYQGAAKGELRVEYYPVKEDGSIITEEDDIFVDDPDTLVGQPLRFSLKIPYARGIPKRFENVFCRYRFFLDTDTTSTGQVTGQNPEFGFSQTHSCTPVTDQFIDYLEKTSLVIEVVGTQIPTPMKAGDERTTKQLMASNFSLNQTQLALMDPEKQIIMGELQSTQRRAKKQQNKLIKVQELLDAANDNESETISVADLQKILESNADSMGICVAVFKMKVSKAREEGNLFKTTAKAVKTNEDVKEVADQTKSKACTIL
ncbi:kinesin-like protein KIF28P isoform X2 [Bolinopsis microptera]|uniref:kinesin-like protein KIF28P isoform X2 n=1 Tax=Bolinopsis microptera TaxID=2820187 RepID=UPI00307A815E